MMSKLGARSPDGSPNAFSKTRVTDARPAILATVSGTEREPGEERLTIEARLARMDLAGEASAREVEPNDELFSAASINSDIVKQLEEHGFEFAYVDCMNHAVYFQPTESLRWRVPLDFRPKRFWFVEFEALLDGLDQYQS